MPARQEGLVATTASCVATGVTLLSREVVINTD